MTFWKNKQVLFLTQALKGKQLHIVLLFLLQGGLGICGVFQALLLREAIDGAVRGQEEVFFRMILLFAALILLQIFARWSLRYLEEGTRSGLENYYKGRLLQALLRREYAEVTRVHSEEWMTRLTSDATVVADGIVSIFPGVTGMIVKLAGALVLLMVLVPWLGGLLMGIGAILLLFAYGFRKRMKYLHKNVQEADGRVRVFLQERLAGLMLVKVFRAEELSEKEAEKNMQAHRTARMEKNHLSNVCNAGFGMALRGAYLLGAAGCGYGILNGTVSYGTFTAVLQLIGQMQSPLAGMTGYLPRFYSMLASVERLMEAEQYPLEQCESTLPIPELFTELEWKNVTFTYPGTGEAVLRDMSLYIERGEFVALTGPSGCGKSTILKLLLGLYPAEKGQLRLGFAGGAKKELSAECREMISYVPQGKYLLGGSIRDIVALGQPEEADNEEKIKNALQLACAEFVFELENGVDTILGENGAGLSEGQLQRLSIARAVFSGRKILLLDEATSALDEATERRFLKQLREQKDYTVLIVTHRPVALEFCDRVIDMEQFSCLKTEERQN